MDAEDIVLRLKEGNARFVADQLEGNLQDEKRRIEVVTGQDPHTVVLSCADSRVVPELAFDAGIGELFVLRVAGNIANTSTIASIEYAVVNLGSKVIVVLGHQSCGAVTAAVKGGDYGYNLNHLLAHMVPALAASGTATSVNDVVKINADMTVKDLTSRSDILRDAANKGKLMIVPAYYSLEDGSVTFY